MRWILHPLVAAICLGLLASHVSALPTPRSYFLEDTEEGPLADGLLRYYDPLRPVLPNETAPQTRLVFAGASEIVPVQFLTASNETHPTKLRGPVFMSYFPGVSTVSDGNMTILLIEIPEGYAPLGLPIDLPIGLPISDPELPAPVGPAAPRLLAQTSLALDANLSNLPEPTALVPPGQPDPSNPQAYATYVAAYELMMLMPALGVNARLLYVGNVDTDINATSRLALRFTLTPENPDDPLPVGAFGQFQYNHYPLAYSFVYIPWDDPTKTTTKYPTKPPGSSTSKAPGTVAVPSSKPPATGGVTTENNGKATPDAGLLLLPALGLLALALRRRLPK